MLVNPLGTKMAVLFAFNQYFKCFLKVEGSLFKISHREALRLITYTCTNSYQVMIYHLFLVTCYSNSTNIEVFILEWTWKEELGKAISEYQNILDNNILC